MFTPKFNLTPAIVNQLTSIERLYGQLISEKMIPSLALKLNQENMVLATHYSTSIEGNPLKPREVTNIVLGDTIPTSKSEKEVKNYFDALNHITIASRHREPFSVKLTVDTHEYVMRGIDIKYPGKFRSSKVIVGHKGIHGLVVKHDPPAHTEKGITHLLNELFNYIKVPSQYSPLIQAGLLHHQLAFIHPFYDGNGRVTRLLTAYYLMIHDYQVSKYFILDDYYDIDRLQYSDKLHSADQGDQTEWLEYFLEGIEHSVRAALNRIQDLSERHIERIKGDKRVLVTPREEEALQIVIDLKKIKTQDVVAQLQVSRQQAHALLAGLVDKEIIEKIGKTKASYYQLRGKQR